jgi:tripartite-type tricarboxylate transporter receptor subunit TctC
MKMMWKRLLAAMLALSASFAVCAADGYPTRPIRIIIGFPPGGSDDYLARVIGPKLAERLAQNIVVDNRPGAASNLGAELTARANPDGYTLFLGPISTLAASATLYPKLGYDLLKDFSYVTLVATQTNVLLAHPSTMVRSFQELVARARNKPMRYASVGQGSGSHLAMELLRRRTGMDLQHIPYNGGGPAGTALLSGEVDIGFVALSVAVPQIEAKRLNALAVTSLKRLAALPSVPTIAESGVPGFNMVASFGILAPAATPAALVQRLNAEVRAVLGMEDVRKSFAVRGMDAEGSTSAGFRARTQAMVVELGRLIRDANIRLD